MIVSRWSPWFTAHYGGVLPDDYLCCDVETTGFLRDKDLVVQWGHCLVQGRQVVDRLSVVINWFDSDVPAEWLSWRLRKVRRDMALAGRPYHLTEEKVRAGVPPRVFFPWLHGYLADTLAAKLMHVMHNGVNFDVDMIQGHMRTDVGDESFTFDDHLLFDTGAVVKASQMADDPKVLPRPGEPLLTYFRRVNHCHAPKGTKWNLDDYCVKAYGLPVNPAALHDASEDAYTLHLLFEKIRALADAAAAPKGSHA